MHLHDNNTRAQLTHNRTTEKTRAEEIHFSLYKGCFKVLRKAELSIYLSICNHAALEDCDLQLTLVSLIRGTTVKISKSINAPFHTVTAPWRQADMHPPTWSILTHKERVETYVFDYSPVKIL